MSLKYFSAIFLLEEDELYLPHFDEGDKANNNFDINDYFLSNLDFAHLSDFLTKVGTGSPPPSSFESNLDNPIIEHKKPWSIKYTAVNRLKH